MFVRRKKKRLVMKTLESQMAEVERFKYMDEKVGYKADVVEKTKTIKNSQFAQPLFEFSGACAGCGETPYIKTITQLYGEQMMVANATGCSSIYGGSAPSTPYCKHKESGQGTSLGQLVVRRQCRVWFWYERRYQRTTRPHCYGNERSNCQRCF
jgi:hypothetical protein